MNEYSFEQCVVGTKASFDVVITEAYHEMFGGATGDINPMHTDNSYAVSRGYRGEIVYGMCTASFYSTLVGVYLPGKYALLLGIDVQFPKPVYIGDRLKVSGTIIDRDDVYRRITIKAEMRNQNGEKVSRAKILVGLIDNSFEA